MELFGSSGIRGVALRYLTPELVLGIAKAAGTTWDADRVAVARDTRTTGELFANAAASGLAAVGCDVDRLGVVPTPAVGNYCESAGIPCVLVTASHNPPEFNGIKLVGDDGVELSVDVLERVERRVLDDETTTTPTGGTRALQPASSAPSTTTSTSCSTRSTARRSPTRTSRSRSTPATARRQCRRRGSTESSAVRC